MRTCGSIVLVAAALGSMWSCHTDNTKTAPKVMNTSFNLLGETIVCTPTDAVRTFFSSGMDALVIGNFLVEK